MAGLEALSRPGLLLHLTFLIQHSLGMDGMPRRIYEYSSGNGWTLMNQI